MLRTSSTANQIASSGFSYDPNGNLVDDGSNAYTWDRANRLLSMGGHSYAYDGEGRRIAQTVSGVITKYLFDVQPGLAQVIAATTGASTTRYVHDIGGIQAVENSSGVWSWMLNDGQGSVRMVMPSGTAFHEMLPSAVPHHQLTFSRRADDAPAGAARSLPTRCS
ncbi:MAG: hypothetical protein JNL42_08425 [Anaerolineae bacterium]|nr:hypothetical protein [Anaerolineae bacterium]